MALSAEGPKRALDGARAVMAARTANGVEADFKRKTTGSARLQETRTHARAVIDASNTQDGR